MSTLCSSLHSHVTSSLFDITLRNSLGPYYSINLRNQVVRPYKILGHATVRAVSRKTWTYKTPVSDVGHSVKLFNCSPNLSFLFLNYTAEGGCKLVQKFGNYLPSYKTWFFITVIFNVCHLEAFNTYINTQWFVKHNKSVLCLCWVSLIHHCIFIYVLNTSGWQTLNL